MLSLILSSGCFWKYLILRVSILSQCPGLHIWSKILSLYFQLPSWHSNLGEVIYHIFHLSPLGVILVKDAAFFLRDMPENLGPHSAVPSHAATALRTSRKVFLYSIILSLLGLNFCECKCLWFFISVFMMVLTTCYSCLCLYCYIISSFEGRNLLGLTSPVPSLLLMHNSFSVPLYVNGLL